jgi:uncharacterized protein (TIGR04255 family)
LKHGIGYIVSLYIFALFETILPVKYSNNQLVEVNCGFQFPKETIAWDSTFFGQYYERIKELGFKDKEERKGVQITFNGLLVDSKDPDVATSQIEDQVIFRNREKGLAILIGKGKVSFHCVNEYKGWENFLNDFLMPFSEHYKALGLGNGKRQCSVVYLNRFTKSVDEKLSDYLTIISPLEQKFGIEIVSSVQRVISNKENLLIAKLNSQVIEKIQNVNLECGSVCVNEECMNSNDWFYQANQTHEPILSFFEAIITEKLRNEL